MFFLVNIMGGFVAIQLCLQILFSQIYIYVIYRMGGPYWKNILSRSQKRPEAEGRGTFLRPRQNIFPVRTDLNGK